jgi:hypothetical protein
VNQRLFPAAELIESICNENEKSSRMTTPEGGKTASRRSGSRRMM